MQLDHIFIFSASNGGEADELASLGFNEGSSRIHPGQGTTNRKFYFENFFLEILWAHNQEEIQNLQTKPTQLWERSNFRETNYSPFGLCLVNTKESDQIFADAASYQPSYFPEGMAIDYINEPQLPWIFRLPFRGKKRETNEPVVHKRKIHRLTRATFAIKEITDLTASIQQFSGGLVCFEMSSKSHLLLEFDSAKSMKSIDLQELPLTICY